MAQSITSPPPPPTAEITTTSLETTTREGRGNTSSNNDESCHDISSSGNEQGIRCDDNLASSFSLRENDDFLHEYEEEHMGKCTSQKRPRSESSIANSTNISATPETSTSMPTAARTPLRPLQSRREKHKRSMHKTDKRRIAHDKLEKWRVTQIKLAEQFKEIKCKLEEANQICVESKKELLDSYLSYRPSKWNENYCKLQRFKEIHGHCDVPRSKNDTDDNDLIKLGKWVQLQQKRKPNHDNETTNKEDIIDREYTATGYQIEALQRIGLEFKSSNVNLELWEDMYQKLVCFQAEHGHCNVKYDANAVSKSPNDVLGIWVQTQRARLKPYLTGDSNTNGNSAIMNERIARLKNLDFQFVGREHKWSRMYDELRMYKQRNGDCLVSRGRNNTNHKELAEWVSDQRTRYRHYKQGKPSIITEKQIEQLNELQFVWKVRAERSTTTEDEAWAEGYNAFLSFVTEHGHCRVYRRPIKSSVRLREWVAWQQKQYKLRCEGQPSRMTDERVDMLEKLGFEWSKKTNKPIVTQPIGDS
mmetsp:Transcript_18572/g.27217  ORF Transcript_18572/g.27217 Transcript_18572/m.27217 type:complete len:532 (+) Transcript_18572:88-1683(+)